MLIAFKIVGCAMMALMSYACLSMARMCLRDKSDPVSDRLIFCALFASLSGLCLLGALFPWVVNCTGAAP